MVINRSGRDVTIQNKNRTTTTTQPYPQTHTVCYSQLQFKIVIVIPRNDIVDDVGCSNCDDNVDYDDS